MPLFIPDDYTAKLAPETMEQAISHLKEIFPDKLARSLRLRRVTAPLFVLSGTGINDDLNGVERAVSFPVRDLGDRRAEVVHSLAKWKRMKLGAYKIAPGYGLYTDMNAIRADEELDNTHSLYVDQWDWERTIRPEERNLGFLKQIVEKIYDAMKAVEEEVYELFPHITPILPERIAFIQAEELLREFPGLTPKEREQAAARKYGALFLIGIGGALSNGRTTAAPRTTTTGAPRPKRAARASTAISSYGIRCSKAPSNSPAWASASIRRPSNASSPSADANSGAKWSSTACCSKDGCRSRSAAASDSRGSACSTCAAPISAKCRSASGPSGWSPSAPPTAST